MAYQSMREWIQKLEEMGLLQHITTLVVPDLPCILSVSPSGKVGERHYDGYEASWAL